MSLLVEKLLIFGGIPLLIFLIGYLSGKYIKPWLHSSQERLERFEEIAIIADRITDEMILVFPSQNWTVWIDKAVDKLIESCNLKGVKGQEIAKREIRFNIKHKKLN